MEIKAAQEKLTLLKQKILEDIVEFETQTELKINAVDLLRVSEYGYAGRLDDVILSVKMEA